jgi:hypothetical protein
MYHAQVSWWRRRSRIREDATALLPERAAPGDPFMTGFVDDLLRTRLAASPQLDGPIDEFSVHRGRLRCPT